jgi:hypothetical protein
MDDRNCREMGRLKVAIGLRTGSKRACRPTGSALSAVSFGDREEKLNRRQESTPIAGQKLLAGSNGSTCCDVCESGKKMKRWQAQDCQRSVMEQRTAAGSVKGVVRSPRRRSRIGGGCGKERADCQPILKRRTRRALGTGAMMTKKEDEKGERKESARKREAA